MELDKVQQSIVDCNDDKIVVVAGAGSGKTRVLIERIKRLLKSGVKPSSIVTITYTNLASDELKERLKDVKGADGVFAGTIHSFANKILGSDTSTNYIIYSDYEKDKLVAECIEKYCCHITVERYMKYAELRMKVKKGTEKANVLDSFLTYEESSELDYLEGTRYSDGYPLIENIRVERGYITFRELLRRATIYLREQNVSIEHLLVDETQDISTDEYNFIMRLRAKNLFFVGDDWQSIYSFKGSDCNIFLKLINDRAYTSFKMLNNYRNSKLIVQESGKIIRQIPVINKTIKCVRDEKGKVAYGKLENLEDVVEGIKDYSKWFILVRSNKQMAKVGKILSLINVPFTNFTKSDMTLDELRETLKIDSIKLLSVHASKGLEIDNVILYGDYFSPYKVKWQDDEERKVMYVGMTRAKNQLFILNK